MTQPDDRDAQPRAAPGAADASKGGGLPELDGLVQRPLEEHPEVYQAIHTRLQRALADIDQD